MLLVCGFSFSMVVLMLIVTIGLLTGCDGYSTNVPQLYSYATICPYNQVIKIQSTLVISKSKGPSKILRDICTSTYQTCSIEEKTI